MCLWNYIDGMFPKTPFSSSVPSKARFRENHLGSSPQGACLLSCVSYDTVHSVPYARNVVVGVHDTWCWHHAPAFKKPPHNERRHNNYCPYVRMTIQQYATLLRKPQKEPSYHTRTNSTQDDNTRCRCPPNVEATPATKKIARNQKRHQQRKKRWLLENITRRHLCIYRAHRIASLDGCYRKAGCAFSCGLYGVW